MSLGRNDIFITVAGDPSVGIPSITDRIELQWDLDEYPDERNRIRGILQRAWSELYDDKAGVRFGDECPNCGRLKVNCMCEY